MKQLTVAGALLVSMLAGCTGSYDEELREWMSTERANVQPRIAPLPEPKVFTPQAYVQEAAVDPFSTQRLTQALNRDTAQSVTNAALVAPELARRKEPLEAFPLDAMVLVGHLNRGQPVALVQVDKLLYQVRVGNYLGPNYGRVMRITESEVILREIVQDAAGEWTERPATLQLQEKAR